VKRPRKPIKVRKDRFGVWWWWCQHENCRARENHGASMHWEVAMHLGDEHVREYHRPHRVSHDTETPPGGAHYDWSDTGMHLRITRE
jgi:hypothetical protein